MECIYFIIHLIFNYRSCSILTFFWHNYVILIYVIPIYVMFIYVIYTYFLVLLSFSTSHWVFHTFILTSTCLRDLYLRDFIFCFVCDQSTCFSFFGVFPIYVIPLYIAVSMSMSFLTSGFFHKSVVPVPLIHILKYFCHLMLFAGL